MKKKYQKKQVHQSRISCISCIIQAKEGSQTKTSTISCNTFKIITCQEEKHISNFNNQI